MVLDTQYLSGFEVVPVLGEKKDRAGVAGVVVTEGVKD